ncbi:MAG: tandem-95 repeat protein [Acidimicrobiia bacterium]|nr:tandem-95 repeat protein [Acidimicrobiia bacterium]
MAIQNPARMYVTLSTVVMGALLLMLFSALPAKAQTISQISVPASADARVLQDNPGLNYGASSKLDVDSPDEQSFIRFEVGGITGPVESAILRVFVRNGSSDGPAMYPTTNSWTEATITWNNRPAATGSALADVGSVPRNTWIEYDLSDYVTTNGTYDFVFLPDSTNGVRYNSRETASPPELVVVFAEGPANQPPNANDDVASTDEDVAVAIPVTANDTDPDSSIDQTSTNTSCAGCSNPTDGTMINNQDGSFLYTPEADFNGQDAFVYQVCDIEGACDTASVAITVTAVPDPPLASADTASTIETQPVTIDVAANDTDPDGDLDPTTTNTTCPTDCTNPTNGTLTNHGNGTFTYTANQTFTGTDTFTYQICDTLGACNTATATIEVMPFIGDLTFVPSADARVLESTPTLNDGFGSRLDVDSPGEESYIRFTVSGAPPGMQSAKIRLFVSNGSSNGPSLFETSGSWTESGITWNNRPSPIGPAVADIGAVARDTWVEYDVTGHVSGDGTYNFVFLPDSSNGVRFESRETSEPPELVLDYGGSGTNSPPIAQDDNAFTYTDTVVTIPVTSNDSDPDGSLDLTSLNTACGGCFGPTNGALTNNGAGGFDYAPNGGFTGGDGFVYEICDPLGLCDTASVTITVDPPGTGSAVFVGAGDIATCSSNADEETAQLLDNIAGTVYTIGDNAYPNGTAAEYSNCYDPTWGRHKSRTYPVIGDNEYNLSPTAAPYFNYFGPVAGDPDKGYYSYDVGTWHIIALNSNCSEVGGCGPNSPQGQWLQADLVANPNACILALHHDPLFSSKGGDADMVDFWDQLYAAGADIVLSGHSHNYERFAQQTPGGSADPGRGIRQFVVGTGGTSLSSFDGIIAPNSEVREDNTHGVLKLTLHPTGYDWEFVPVAGESFTDSGSTNCVTP